MDLYGKTAVITGAAGGIGSALALALKAEGAQVVVSDLDLERAQALAAEVDGVGVACNVANESEVVALIEAAEAAYGQVDVFVSNAGFAVSEPGHAASASNEVWQRNWDVHVMAHVYAARNLLPKMIERGDGYLVNIASAAGLLAQIADAAYSATKHAAVSLAESLHISHADQGVKVSVVCPQYVNTNIIGDAKRNEGEPLPEGLLTPEACAATIVQGLKDETFLILPHPEVGGYAALRGSNVDHWLAGMRKLKRKVTDENGKVDLSRMVLRD